MLHADSGDDYVAPDDPTFLGDTRGPAEMKQDTLCGQTARADAELLFARILENEAPAAAVICADLVGSFHWRRAWDVLIDVYLRHIHVENAVFLPRRMVDCAQLFQRLESENKYSWHNVRNHRELRMRFAELVVIMCFTRKRAAAARATSFAFCKGAAATAKAIVRQAAGEGIGASASARGSACAPLFHPSVISQYAQATHTRLADAFLADFDLANGTYLAPFFMCINEFMYALENTALRTQHFVQYWVQCMLELHDKRVARNADLKSVVRRNPELYRIGKFLRDFLGARHVPTALSASAATSVSMRGDSGGLFVHAHIVWVLWCICVRFAAVGVAPPHPAMGSCSSSVSCGSGGARPTAGYGGCGGATPTGTILALRELLALFCAQFPMSTSAMLRYFGMVLDLLMQSEVCKFPMSISAVMDAEELSALPPVHLFAERPYLELNKRRGTIRG